MSLIELQERPSTHRASWLDARGGEAAPQLSDAVALALLSTTKNRIMRIGSVGHNPQILPPIVRAGGAREGRDKRPFDNHLEGSASERDRRVAEAMSHRRSHPIEETSDATLRRN
jgi:hypothetical protein